MRALVAVIALTLVGLSLWHPWAVPTTGIGNSAIQEQESSVALPVDVDLVSPNRTPGEFRISGEQRASRGTATTRERKRFWLHAADRNGDGVKGARVVLAESGRSFGHTDVAGDLRVDLVGVDSAPTKLRLRVEAAGFVSVVVTAYPDPADASLMRATVQLQPAGEILGHVFGADHRPWADARVVLMSASEVAERPRSAPPRTPPLPHRHRRRGVLQFR